MIADISNYLCNLININTITDSFNESEAAIYIKNLFDELNIYSKIYEPVSGKGSIYAILHGETNQSIVLHSHLDTVDYNSENWYFPPNKATIFKNLIVGRGSLDCKGLTSIWIYIFKKIYESNKPLKKNLIFLATSDEENGGHFGTEYVLNNSDLLDKNIELVLGEGGGYPIPLGDDFFFTLQTGEIYDELIENHCRENFNYTTDIINNIFEKAKKLGYYNENTDYFYNNLDLQKNRKISQECFYKDIDLLLSNNHGFDNNSLFELFSNEIKSINPKYKILPTITPGYSDNRFFRMKNIKTLGFFPLDPQNYITGIHGNNEYISFESLELAYSLLFKIISKLVY